MRGPERPSIPIGSWASFVSGMQARCPGTFTGKRHGESLPCNARIGDVPVETEVRIRVLPVGAQAGPASLVQQCERCKAQLEIQTLVDLRKPTVAAS